MFLNCQNYGGKQFLEHVTNSPSNFKTITLLFINLQHVKRTFHGASGDVTNKSTGYWIIDLDINSPHTVDRYVPEVKRAQLVEEDCVNHLYCGLSYYVPVLSMIWKTNWIPGPEPYIDNPVIADVLERERLPDGSRVSLRLRGEIISTHGVTV